MNKILTKLVISMLKTFRAKNVKTWSIIVFGVGLLNYALTNAADAFVVSEDFLQVVHWVSVAFLTISNPELNDDDNDNDAFGGMMRPIDTPRVPKTWKELHKLEDIRFVKCTTLSAMGFFSSAN